MIRWNLIILVFWACGRGYGSRLTTALVVVAAAIARFGHDHALVTKVEPEIKESLLETMLIKNLIILILYYKINS